MKKVFRILLWVLLGAVLIGTFVFLFMNSRQKETVYETVTPERGQVERTTVLTGKIEKSSLRFRVLSPKFLWNPATK